MGLISHMDNFTLVVCIALAAFMSSFAFGRTWSTHRLRGSGAFAIAFLLGAVACVFFVLVPPVTPTLRFINTVLGETFIVAVSALVLSGLEQFLNVRRTASWGWGLIAAGFLLNLFFTFVHDSVGARLLVNGVSTLILRVLIAVELLRHTGRRHLRTLAALMGLYAVLSLIGIWAALIQPKFGNVPEWMENKTLEQLSLFTTLVFFIALGQLLFLLLNDELVLQLEDEATTDFMTGTLNRRGIEVALSGEFDRSQRYGMVLSVALVDLDGFKRINDTLGHAAGDDALRSVSELIHTSLRAYDTVGRFGGDEFLIILPNTAGSEAQQVMERICHLVETTSSASVTLSIGLTSMTPTETREALLARVDEALYQAKESGRNCCRLMLPPSWKGSPPRQLHPSSSVRHL